MTDSHEKVKMQSIVKCSKSSEKVLWNIMVKNIIIKKVYFNK